MGIGETVTAVEAIIDLVRTSETDIGIVDTGVASGNWHNGY